ncbi:DUF3316 domain-containing protein [Parasalinivibrio latis]|uniref:DUF3316 domain-containing protein n=1 Tax=Parasalinivibrio latis TaxID=2952610 RepID=UPI0030E0BA9E
MKTLTKLVTAAVIALSSSAVMAKSLPYGSSYTPVIESRAIQVTPADNKKDAFNRAIVQLQSLEAQSSSQLRKSLKVWSPNYIKPYSLHLKENGYVTVDERMNSNGNLEYVGVVNVRFHYLNRDYR